MFSASDGNDDVARARLHGFLPPQYIVHYLESAEAAAWAAIPPVPVLTTLRGSPIAASRADLRLACTDEALVLRATRFSPHPVLNPELPADSPDFWRQEHIEFRLLLAPDAPQIQFIVTPDGRVWDSLGRWRQPGAGGVAATGEAGTVTLRVPLPALGLAEFESGDTIRGILAHTCWPDGRMDIACSSATELGFSHAERFGEFIGAPPDNGAVVLMAVTDHGFSIGNLSDRPVHGRLRVTRESLDDLPSEQLLPMATFAPGEQPVPFAWGWLPERFTRCRLAFLWRDGRITELGAVTLRAPVPPPVINGRGLRHPYLFFTAEELVALRGKLREPPFSALPAEVQLTEADLAGDDVPPDPSAPAGRMDLVNRLGNLWEKWLITDDPRLIRTATRTVRAALRLTVLGPEIHLHEGVAAGSAALAYDAFYPHLTAGERRVWQQLLRRFLDLYLDTARRPSWTVTTIANANPVGNGGCGLAALALWRKQPRVARAALRYAREYLWHWLDYASGVCGGNTEGAQYWQYGMENFLRFAVALERVTGSDDGLLSHPAVRNSMNMVRVALSNDGSLHGVNDTIPLPVAGNLAWFMAGRFGDDLGLWYGDHARRYLAARRAAGKPAPYGASPAEMLLYRPLAFEQFTAPPLPVAFTLDDIQYAVIRSAPTPGSRWVAGLKGSRPPYTHHNQPDTASFYVDLRGERLLIDPGYYKPAPTDHCLPLIGTRGPVTPTTWTGTITACESAGDRRHLAVEATAAYDGAATRVVRHLVLVGEEALVLLDDIVTAAPVRAQYQCGGVPLPQEPAVVLVQGPGATLRLEWLGREGLAPVLHPERSLHDTHWGYHFADCRLFPVTVDYAAEELAPLVTVFTDVTNAAPGPSQLERAGRELTVILPSDHVVCFVYTRGAWHYDGGA